MTTSVSFIYHIQCKYLPHFGTELRSVCKLNACFFRAVKLDELSVSQGDAVTILSTNLAKGYLVRKEGVEERGWIPAYTLHLKPRTKHGSNPASSWTFRVNGTDDDSRGANKVSGAQDNFESGQENGGSSQNNLDSVLSKVCELLENDKRTRVLSSTENITENIESKHDSFRHRLNLDSPGHKQNTDGSRNNTIPSTPGYKQTLDNPRRNQALDDPRSKQTLERSGYKPTLDQPLHTPNLVNPKNKRPLLSSKSKSFSSRSSELKSLFLSEPDCSPLPPVSVSSLRLQKDKPKLTAPRSLGKLF